MALQAHQNAAHFVQAFSLGRLESLSAVNLLHHIPTSVKEVLTTLVRRIVFWF